jgi:cyclopropane fatty-acyl-phospholipid synthase-like methyltransferase
MISKPLLALAARESLSMPRLERRAGSAKAFDTNADSLRVSEEATTRALQGVYHFCALAASRLLPEGGLVLDLGSGSGGFATYLADRRPDVTIMGVESFPGRVELGQQLIHEANLQDRVCIYEGEITEFSKRITSSIDMVTAVLSLHQLNTIEDLLRCFHDISYVRIRGGCGVFLFDWARPNQAKTTEEFGAAFMPGAAASVSRECRNALVSSFTFKNCPTPSARCRWVRFTTRSRRGFARSRRTGWSAGMV